MTLFIVLLIGFYCFFFPNAHRLMLHIAAVMRSNLLILMWFEPCS